MMFSQDFCVDGISINIIPIYSSVELRIDDEKARDNVVW